MTKKVDAISKIQEMAELDTGSIFFLDHAEMRMIERGITRRQILNVLKRGEFFGEVEWCTKEERGWKCKFRDISAGERISVVAKLVERQNGELLLVVTTF